MVSSNLISITNLIISILTLIIAFSALHSWKRQFNKNLLRDFILAALDAVHEISHLNFKIVQKLNEHSEENFEFIRISEYFLNPIPANHQNLIENFEIKIANLNKTFDRLNALKKDEKFKELTEKYLICMYEIGEFFLSDELVGFNHPEGQKKNIRRWSTDWLDKACDQEHFLAIQIEECLIKMLKI